MSKPIIIGKFHACLVKNPQVAKLLKKRTLRFDHIKGDGIMPMVAVTIHIGNWFLNIDWC